MVPTPIELLNFTAVSDNTQVNLAWTTATEINNNYFTVEKSRDGRNFTPVVSVPGAGNSTFSLSYKAVDEEPYQGVSYYRLKQTDYDGKYTYSDLVPIKFESQAGLVVLNPNPAHDDLSVIVYSQDHVPGIITIISSQGQKVFETSKELEKGINRISVDLTGMAKGVYFVTLEIGTDIRKARLVKD
ncbi:MAG: T9SS type A sorting domain-containing protein [Bacteroidia bacterium]|nr:T9SS type A sorting domain-containing protein [Bacteroidia bacterium]